MVVVVFINAVSHRNGVRFRSQPQVQKLYWLMEQCITTGFNDDVNSLILALSSLTRQLKSREGSVMRDRKPVGSFLFYLPSRSSNILSSTTLVPSLCSSVWCWSKFVIVVKHWSPKCLLPPARHSIRPSMKQAAHLDFRQLNLTNHISCPFAWCRYAAFLCMLTMICFWTLKSFKVRNSLFKFYFRMQYGNIGEVCRAQTFVLIRRWQYG